MVAGLVTVSTLSVAVLRIKSNCYGFDISETAVAKARHSFPEYTFRIADLTLMKNQRLALSKDFNDFLCFNNQ